MTTMLKQLEKFYLENGILSTHFTCKSKDDCKGNCETFTGPKSAYVGEGYEAGGVPRLLFVSLDSGGAEKEPEHRLPIAVRDGEQNTVVDDLPKYNYWHWYFTYKLAWYILKRFDSKFERADDVKGFFAHANSAKCCMNKVRRELADNRLFENCRGYLEGELKVLAPQLLVTQGQWAVDAIHSFRGDEIETVDKWASVVMLLGKPVFWLHTHHPSYYVKSGGQDEFYKQVNDREKWEFYADKMHEFIGQQNNLK